MIAQRQHHLLQLRHARLRRLQINRRNIEERIAHRQHQRLPLQHLRPLLVPQRQIFRNILILIDAGIHLHRPQNQLLFRKLHHHNFAELVAIAPRQHHADQILLRRGSECRHQQKLRFRFAGQRRINIRRTHRLRLGILTARIFRQFPDVFVVIKCLRIPHVINPVNIRLHAEQFLRIPRVGPQRWRHLRCILDTARETASDRRQSQDRPDRTRKDAFRRHTHRWLPSPRSACN